MSNINQILAILTMYRLLTVIVGLAFAYMGYKLFCRGIYDRTGDIDAAWGDLKLVMKRAAPGTFFALFGTVIIVFSLWKGVDVERTPTLPPPEAVISGEIVYSWAKEDRLKFWAALGKAANGEILSEQERDLFWRLFAEQKKGLEKYKGYEEPSFFEELLKGHTS